MKRLNLVVKFDHKDIAKSRGARWDPVQKKWYILDPGMTDLLNLFPFLEPDMRSDLVCGIVDTSSYLVDLHGKEVEIDPLADMSRDHQPAKPVVHHKKTKNRGNQQTKSKKWTYKPQVKDHFKDLDPQSASIRKQYNMA
ncbi:MAG: DUF5710 domain-containing protein [Desulfuromonadaceae bacterium]